MTTPLFSLGDRRAPLLLIAGAILLAALPRTGWATPAQDPRRQTVPTLTSTIASPTAIATERSTPSPTSPPGTEAARPGASVMPATRLPAGSTSPPSRTTVQASPGLPQATATGTRGPAASATPLVTAASSEDSAASGASRSTEPTSTSAPLTAEEAEGREPFTPGPPPRARPPATHPPALSADRWRGLRCLAASGLPSLLLIVAVVVLSPDRESRTDD